MFPLHLEEGRLLVGLGHVSDLLVEGIPAREAHHPGQPVLGVQRRVQGQGTTLVSEKMK